MFGLRLFLLLKKEQTVFPMKEVSIIDKENENLQKILLGMDQFILFLQTIFRTYIDTWKKSFDFKGITKRIDFWYFLGVDFLILSLFVFVGGEVAATILFPYMVIGILPRLAIVIRRLRDADKSFFWLLILLVPGFGTLILWYQLAQPSKTDRRLSP